MDIKLDIDPKDIENHVVTAIVTSSFGTQLKTAVDDALKKMGNSWSYDNELKKWVEQKMKDIAWNYVTTNYEKQIEEAIKTWLTTEKMKEVTDKVIGEVVRKLSFSSY